MGDNAYLHVLEVAFAGHNYNEADRICERVTLRATVMCELA